MSVSRSQVLFLCTGNSCRSQMAEAWARHLRGAHYDAYSAGVETHGLNPHAVAVMREVGIDMTQQRSQHIDEFCDQHLDTVITVCGRAAESCPCFSVDTEVVHHPFDDPPALAREAASPEAALDCYRRVRDEIRAFIENDLDALGARPMV